MAIKNFTVSKYHHQSATLGTVECPAKFWAEIEGNESLEELVRYSIKHIKNNTKEKGPGIWPAFEIDARIPYDNKEVDESNGVAAFVLLNEIPVVGGHNIKEAIYGIHRDNKELRGRLIAYDYSYGNKYFRHVVDKIEDCVLIYRKIQGQEREYKFDLKEI